MSDHDDVVDVGEQLSAAQDGDDTATQALSFAATTTVLGVLALLGACSIPPGGLVTCLVLPFWPIAAAVIVASGQAAAARGVEAVPVSV